LPGADLSAISTRNRRALAPPRRSPPSHNAPYCARCQSDSQLLWDPPGRRKISGRVLQIFAFQPLIGAQTSEARPISTFASPRGRHFCECWNQRTTSKILMLVELWI
jgi:hypothetical protein